MTLEQDLRHSVVGAGGSSAECTPPILYSCALHASTLWRKKSNFLAPSVNVKMQFIDLKGHKHVNTSYNEL